MPVPPARARARVAPRASGRPSPGRTTAARARPGHVCPTGQGSCTVPGAWRGPSGSVPVARRGPSGSVPVAQRGPTGPALVTQRGSTSPALVTRRGTTGPALVTGRARHSPALVARRAARARLVVFGPAWRGPWDARGSARCRTHRSRVRAPHRRAPRHHTSRFGLSHSFAHVQDGRQPRHHVLILLDFRGQLASCGQLAHPPGGKVTRDDPRKPRKAKNARRPRRSGPRKAHPAKVARPETARPEMARPEVTRRKAPRGKETGAARG